MVRVHACWAVELVHDGGQHDKERDEQEKDRDEVFWVSDHCGDPPTRRRYVSPFRRKVQISHQVGPPLPHVISNSSQVVVATSISRRTQLAFFRSPLMLLAYAFNPIPVLAAIVRKLFGDLIQSAWRGPRLASIGVELHQLPDVEFVHLDQCFRQVP
jgi:hypothetical protein